MKTFFSFWRWHSIYQKTLEKVKMASLVLKQFTKHLLMMHLAQISEYQSKVKICYTFMPVVHNLFCGFYDETQRILTRQLKSLGLSY